MNQKYYLCHRYWSLATGASRAVRRGFVLFAAAIFLLNFFSPVKVLFADGIMAEYVNLSDCFKQTGRALKVKVDSVDVTLSTLSGDIEKVWERPTQNQQKNFPEETVFKIQSPPKTYVPGKWLLYQTYWNTVPLSQIEKNSRVWLVPAPRVRNQYYVLADTKNNQYKLDVLLHEDWLTHYSDTATIKQLSKDLADFDLYTFAYDSLQKRSKLKDSFVIEALAKTSRHMDLLNYHISKLDERHTGLFYQDLLKYVSKNKSPRLIDIIESHLRNFTQKKVDLAIGFNELLADDVKEQVEVKSRLIYTYVAYLKTEQGSMEADKFVDLFLDYLKVRTDTDSYPVNVLSQLLSEATRKEFTSKLIPMLHTTAIGKKYGIDVHVFDIVKKFVIHNPQECYAELLAAYGPSEGDNLKEYFWQMVEMLTVIAEKHPATIPIVRKKVGLYLDEYKKYVGLSTLTRYFNAISAEKTSPSTNNQN